MHYWRRGARKGNVPRLYVCGVNPQQVSKFVVRNNQRRLSIAPEVQISDSLDAGVDALLCIDWLSESRKYVIQARKLGVRTVLVSNEPSSVIPEHDRRKIRELFDQVIEVGRPQSHPTIYWPQTWPEGKPLDQSPPRQARAVMVQSAKYSFVKGQLYSLRAQFVSSDSRVDLFGLGWTASSFRTAGRLSVDLYRAIRGRAPINLDCINSAFLRPLCYRGSTPDKLKTMSNFKVAVVIENSRDVMTEKLFDALFAGCIPVYVGPTLEKFDIPANLYIRADANVGSVSSAVTEALALNYDEWKAKSQKFLSDKKTQTAWKEATVVSRILTVAIPS
jgi:hypothetical protein